MPNPREQEANNPSGDQRLNSGSLWQTPISRRDFLKLSGLVAAGAVVTACAPGAEGAPQIPTVSSGDVREAAATLSPTPTPTAESYAARVSTPVPAALPTSDVSPTTQESNGAANPEPAVTSPVLPTVEVVSGDGTIDVNELLETETNPTGGPSEVQYIRPGWMETLFSTEGLTPDQEMLSKAIQLILEAERGNHTISVGNDQIGQVGTVQTNSLRLRMSPDASTNANLSDSFSLNSGDNVRVFGLLVPQPRQGNISWALIGGERQEQNGNVSTYFGFSAYRQGTNRYIGFDQPPAVLSPELVDMLARALAGYTQDQVATSTPIPPPAPVPPEVINPIFEWTSPQRLEANDRIGWENPSWTHMTDDGGCTWQLINHPILGPNTVEYTVRELRESGNNFRAYPTKEGIPPGDNPDLDWEIETTVIFEDGYLPTEEGQGISLASAFNQTDRVDGRWNCMLGLDCTNNRKAVLSIKDLATAGEIERAKSSYRVFDEEGVPYNIRLGKKGRKAYGMVNGKKVVEAPFDAGSLHGFHAGAYGVGLPVGSRLLQGSETKVRFWFPNA